MSTIKLKKARNKYYDEGKTIRNCPNCNQELIEEKNSILLAVKSEKDAGQFITNLPTSRICQKCPVVVFDKLELEEAEAARLGIRKSKKIKYSVIGIVDYSKSPTGDINKKNDINKEDDKIIINEKPEPIISINKTKRNDKCPCGSGKKYKKCCLNN